RLRIRAGYGCARYCSARSWSCSSPRSSSAPPRCSCSSGRGSRGCSATRPGVSWSGRRGAGWSSTAMATRSRSRATATPCSPMLRGRTVQIQATRDARGNMVLEHGVPDPADLTGATVTLTLDSAIQLTAEKELGKAVKAAGAIGGWAVVLDVRSGAVLALAGNPVFDANKPGRDPMVWRDRAVQDQLEPGSTIKSFVVARAIEEGVLRSDELLYCEHGVWAHAGRKIHDTHPVDWATPATVLRESSNICAAKIGERLGKEKIIEGLKAFGFGEKTGVGL